MKTIIAYALTLAAVFSSITSLLSLPFGYLGKAGGPLLASLFGSICVWLLIDLLWVWLEGAHVPIAALGGAMVVLFLHEAIKRNELTDQSRWLMVAEQWAIVLVGLYLVSFVSSEVRWY